MPSPWMTKTCEECGKTWQTRSLKARTCSPKCRAILREREHPSPGAPPREYEPELVDRVRQMYLDGATIREIDAAIGRGIKTQLLIERIVEERREPGKRDQLREKNDSWRGDQAGYNAMHLRVITARGRPGRCAMCDTADPAIRYEWANLSGHYEDVNDYVRACPACHRRLDARRRADLGHNTMPAKEVV